VLPLQADRLADPQPAARQQLEEQPVTLRRQGQQGFELRPAERLRLLFLFLAHLLPVGQRESLRRIRPQQPFAHGRRQCRPQWDRDIRDARIAQVSALALALRRGPALAPRAFHRVPMFQIGHRLLVREP
jgi:hypothetical protein